MAFRTIKEALDRVDITGITQVLVAGEWVSQIRAADAWAPLGAGLKARRLEVRGKKGRLKTLRDEANDALDVLHNLTAQGLGMARSKYRRNSTVLKALSLRSAGGHGKQTILDEAAEWRIAWTELPDADWEPLATNTHEILDAAYLDAETKFTAFKVALQDERKARLEFYEDLGHAWEDCVEWLADAELVFEDGTPNGELVRAVVDHKGDNEEDDATETGSGTGPGGTDVGDGLPPK